MAEPEKVDSPAEPSEQEYTKPNPEANPRNIALNEIAKRVAEVHKTEAQETLPEINEENIQPVAAEPAPAPTEPAAAEPSEPVASPEVSSTTAPAPAAAPNEEPIDPKKLYKLIVDGVEVEVPGQKIIDAGKRTFQKETAADYRLKMAEELLRTAEARAAAASQPAQPAPAPKPAEPSLADLAQAIQFGTPEQAQEALKILQARQTPAIDPQKLLVAVRAQARDEYNFQNAAEFVKREYPDLLANDHLKRLFFAEEQRYRTPKEQGGLGDTRNYQEVYRAIGDDLRKAFNLQKPGTAPSNPSTATAKGRQEMKANMAPAPKTAASRLQEATQRTAAKSTGDIIAGMAAARGQGRLTPLRKE